jgi:hypothetical protein
MIESSNAMLASLGLIGILTIAILLLTGCDS